MQDRSHPPDIQESTVQDHRQLQSVWPVLPVKLCDCIAVMPVTNIGISVSPREIFSLDRGGVYLQRLVGLSSAGSEGI